MMLDEIVDHITGIKSLELRLSTTNRVPFECANCFAQYTNEPVAFKDLNAIGGNPFDFKTVLGKEVVVERSGAPVTDFLSH